ncbi:hypothetical protein [Microbacterium maritypicum]
MRDHSGSCLQLANRMRRGTVNHLTQATTDASDSSSEIAGRVFVIAFSLGIAVGVVGTVAMMLAAAAFATASTFVIPFVATFDGFRDAGGTNAVTVTGSWEMAGVLTVALAFLLSIAVLRRAGASSH